MSTGPRIPQVNFSKGELAPALYGRYDVESYQGALKTARNVFILKYGGVCKRPGTWFVGEALDSSNPTRLVPFQFSLTQAYALEFGEGYVAPCLQGGRLLEGELTITGITNATHAQVTVPYHGYAAGDFVFLDGIAGDLGKLLNNRTVKVLSVVDASNFTINVDTSTAPAFTSATGGTTNSAPPVVVIPPTVGSTAPTSTGPTSSGLGVSTGGIRRSYL